MSVEVAKREKSRDRPRGESDSARAAKAGKIHTRGARFLRRQWRPLLLIGFIVLVLSIFREVLTPFIIAFALAYVLLPAVQRISRLQVRGAHLPIWTATLVVYAVLIGGIWGLFSLAGPPVLVQLQKLIDNVPVYAEQAEKAQQRLVVELERVLYSWERTGDTSADDFVGPPADLAGDAPAPGAPPGAPATAKPAGFAPRPPQVSQAVTAFFTSIKEQAFERLKETGAQLPAFVQRLAEYIFDFFLVLMLTFMFIVYFPALSAFALRLVPQDYTDEFKSVASEINHRLAGVVRGQLVICLVNGVLTYIGFAMIGVNFPSLLAFVAGVLSLIPIFGTIFSTVPAVLIGLTQSLPTALMVLLWVILIHMLEAYVLNPKIMGDSAHMNPLLIIFALLVGSHYFHPVLGPLLAAPIAAIIQTVFLHFLTRQDVPTEKLVTP
jgi:predicted PurR-regulated permease PerM